MGVVFQDQGKLDEAIKAYEKVLKIQPGFADPYYNMGVVFQDQGKLNEAIEAYKKAIQMNPKYAEAYYNMGIVFKDKGKLDNAIDAFKKSISIKPDYFEAFSNLIYLMAQMEPADSRILHNIADKYNQATLSMVRQPFQNNRFVRSKKLRLGFVSGDMRDHPVGYFLQNLFKYIDKDKIDIYVYSNSDSVTELTHFLKQFVYFWKNITNVSDHKTAEIIYERFYRCFD